LSQVPTQRVPKLVIMDDGAIHHQDVASLDTGVAHGATLNPDEERGCRVAHEVLVQVERVLHVILGRRRKPSLDVGGSQRDAQFGTRLEGDGLAYYDHWGKRKAGSGGGQTGWDIVKNPRQRLGLPGI